jgi:hypothetical protein
LDNIILKIKPLNCMVESRSDRNKNGCVVNIKP